MNEAELDEVYTELCQALSARGRDAAPALLARFALLAMHEIGDAGKVRRLLAAASREGAATSVGSAGDVSEPRR
jgi:hypothetical protein